MTPDPRDADADGVSLPRRRLLTVGSSATLLGFASSRILGTGSGPVAHDRRLQVERDGVDLVVDWAEWYNGSRLGEQGSPVDADGPVVTLSNVLPGDSGRLHFGLGLERANDGGAPVQLSMRLGAPTGAYAENGRTRGERAAGDESTDGGELQDYLDVTVWHDTGVGMGDVALVGRCDGTREEAEPVIAAGSLAEVTAELADWTPLDATPSIDGRDCLAGDDRHCLGLAWHLPTDLPDVNDDVIQTDGAAFDIGFRASSCPGVRS